jgi:hypothetical protein
MILKRNINQFQTIFDISQILFFPLYKEYNTLFKPNRMAKFNQQYWNDRHSNEDTPWHLQSISPPLKVYIDQLKDKHNRILIPGAGHPHEASYLLALGFTNITVCDISELAIENIRNFIGPSDAITYFSGDFFELEGTYDLILEQTFFCALEPALRGNYIQKMYDLLAENGTLAGLLFASEFAFEGPPFGGTIEEYKTLFGKNLYILSIDMCYNSVVPRQGNELFFICKKSNF